MMEEEKTDVPTPVTGATFDRALFEALLAAGEQRARLLAHGVAGPLTERQRLPAMDVVDDLEQALEVLGPVAPRRVPVGSGYRRSRMGPTFASRFASGIGRGRERDTHGEQREAPALASRAALSAPYRPSTDLVAGRFFLLAQEKTASRVRKRRVSFGLQVAGGDGPDPPAGNPSTERWKES